MQLLITHGSMARTRVLLFQRWQIVGAVVVLATLLMLEQQHARARHAAVRDQELHR